MLKGEGTLGTGHWREITATALTQGEIRQSMKLGGQGNPVMLAAGAATGSLPPTAKASDQTAVLALALRSPLHGSCAVQVRRTTVLAVCRHSAYTANAQSCENSIISSLKWIVLGKMPIFLTWHYGFLQCQWKSAGIGMACI